MRRHGAGRRGAHDLLVRAAVGGPDVAPAAWAAWQRLVDLDDVDERSFALLPQVYRNLVAQGVDGASLLRLRNVHRHDWLRRQVTARSLRAAAVVLGDAGVPTLTVGGAARIRHHGPDPARPLTDSALVVPTGRVVAADAALRAAGWSAPATGATRRGRHRWTLLQDGAGTVVPVRDGVLHPPYDGDDAVLWARSRDGVLTPGDELASALLDGAGSPSGTVPWALDVVMLLRHARDGVDWDAFAGLVRDRRLELPVRRGLAEVRRLSDAAPPAEVLASVAARRPTAGDRLELWCRRHGSFGVHWFRYLRAVRAGAARPGPAGLLGWARDGRSGSDVPALVSRRAGRRLSG